MTRTRTPTIAAAVSFVAMALSGSAALAQPRDNPIERARHHMELGQEAFALGRYEDAADEFVNAYTASPFSAFLYNAGLAFEKVQDKEQAADFYRRYLEEDPQAPDAPEVELKIRALLAEAETPPAEGEVAPGVPEEPGPEGEMKSLISVRTNPPDAKIRILDPEGTEVSSFEGPSGKTVVRGMYTLEASHPDFRTVQTEISVIPGQVYIVVVEMSQGAFLGFLHIKTDVPGAEVYIDDKEQGSVGSTPWGNVLPSGTHKVWIEKPGYEPIEEEIEINIGDQISLDYELQRPDFGSILAKTNTPGSKVFVDEQFMGVAPFEEPCDPGVHQIRVSAEGMKDYLDEITVSRGQTTKVLVRLNPTPSRTSAWVSLGFSVLFFAGGGVFGYLAMDLNDELESARNSGRLADDDPRILEGFLWALGADVSFGVGAIVGGMCIYYFLRDPLPPSEGKIYDPVDFSESSASLALDEEEAAAVGVPDEGEAEGATPDDSVGPPAPTEAPDGGIAPEEVPEGDATPEEAPEGDATPEGDADPEETLESAPAPTASLWGSRLMVTPIVTQEAAGLGVAVVF